MLGRPLLGVPLKSFRTHLIVYRPARACRLLSQAPRGPTVASLHDRSIRRSFHSTPPRQAMPFIALLASLLKASYSLEFIRTAGRVVLTFVPVISLKSYGTRRYLQHVDHAGNPPPEKEKGMLLQRIRTFSRLNKILISIPVVLVLATILASMERTPLTGRLRFILLSPEEEDVIAKQLAGEGWYNAVGDILAKEDKSPRFIPETDWRFAWVQETLRRLERTIPMLAIEHELEPGWLDRPENVPFPPPAEWPLQPRPRATESLRAFCNMLCERKAHRGPHSIPGPPYSLLIVENPDASNAFSYGFGPDGGGGVVIYSGFLDHILSQNGSSPTNVPEGTSSSTRSSSWFASLFGALFPPSSQTPPHPTPTPEQTTDLAILLAHELAHLILSHHLESMSSSTIVIPSLVSIMADVVRVVLFPVTMLFGPFVNDAVAQLGQAGTMELAELTEMCANKSQEIEADVVSVRLLAYAGFDVQHAVEFWERRQDTTRTAECSLGLAEKQETAPNLTQRIMGEYHPDSAQRVQILKNELMRWKAERQAALARLAKSQRSR